MFGLRFNRKSKDEWYHTALTDCADGFWDLDVAKLELYLSPKLRELIGYKEEETKNTPLSWWLSQIHPNDRSDIQRKIDEFLHSQSHFIYLDAFRFLCKTKDYIWLENHAKVLRNRKGEPIRLTGLTLNITHQKFIQHQLRTIIAEQEKEARSRQRFLSTLNHELRSPLTGIMGMTTLLKETPLSADQNHYIDNIANSADMILTLVNDFLDVSKLNSGKFKFEKINFSPTEVIQRAADLIRPTLIKKNLSFKLLIKDKIPEYLIGDPTRLQQILVNLLSNAAKFTITGGITLVMEEARENTFYFEVSDTGIGIPPDVQDHLFQDFTQANTSITRVYGGTGLGLAICKELVNLMGGKIGVKSQPGKGSTFWFEIPFEASTTQILPAMPQETDASTLVPQSNLTILLVEDNFVNQEVMQGLLRLLGDRVVIANNGQEAIKLFTTQKFDVVLMDLNMPVLDGLSAAEAIRKLPHGDVPIIAVTANTFANEQENLEKHGIKQILNKPVIKSNLEQALARHRSSYPILDSQQNLIETSQALSEMVNAHILQTLMKDLGKDKVIQLLELYRNDGLKLVQQMKNASPQDSKGYAHTLAGMSENLGFQAIGKMARDIMGASQNDLERLPFLIQDLERQFENSCTEIQNISHNL